MGKNKTHMYSIFEKYEQKKRLKKIKKTSCQFVLNLIIYNLLK